MVALYPRAADDMNMPKNLTTCGPRPQPGQYGAPFIGKYSFLTAAQSTCLVMLVISAICWFWTTWSHLHNFTRSKEQRQMIRIVFLPFLISAVSFVAVMDYQISLYIIPVYDMYEAFCFGAIWLLYNEWVCPDASHRDEFFDNLDRYDRKKRFIPGGSLSWFKYTWLLVLQYPFVAVALDTATIVTQALNTYCSNSFSAQYFHIWDTVISIVVLGTAIGQLIFFALRLIHGKLIAPEHRPSIRFWAFKIPIFLFFVQNILFSFVLKSTPANTSSKVTYDDIYFGIPNLVRCIEGAIISLAYTWAYSAREYKHYKSQNPADGTRTRTLRAILSALNLSDIALATLESFHILFTLQWRGGSTPHFRQDKLAKHPNMQQARSRGRSPPNQPFQPQQYGVVDVRKSHDVTVHAGAVSRSPTPDGHAVAPPRYGSHSAAVQDDIAYTGFGGYGDTLQPPNSAFTHQDYAEQQRFRSESSPLRGNSDDERSGRDMV
ncbi:hypothetical protein MBLNU457_1827t1 [Dothideomycetes sp. NU457]